MLTNEERLALVLEANDNATATLQRVRKEVEALGGSTNRGRKGTSELGGEFDKLSDQKIVKSARAMQSVAIAAGEAKLGGREAARAIGDLAENLALASGNAKFATWAIGLNAAVLALSSFIGLLRDSAEQTKPTEQYLARLSHLGTDQAKAEIAQLRAQRDSILQQTAGDADKYWTRFRKFMSADLATDSGRRIARQGGVDFELLDHTNANLEALTKKVIVEQSEAERKRLLGLQDQTVELVKQKDVELSLGSARIAALQHQISSLDLAKDEARAAKLNADAQVDAMFRYRDADGQLHKLTAAELAMKGELLERNRANYKLAVDTATVLYAQSVGEERYQNKQTLFFAQRRLTQNDYLNSLDDVLQNYERQVHAIKLSQRSEEDKKALIIDQNQLYTAQIDLIKRQHEIQTRKLRAQNDVDDTENSRFGLVNVGEEYKAKIKQIDEMRRLAILAGEDEVEATRRAENEKRKLRRDTIEQAKQNFKTIEDVLIASNSRQVKAVGHAAQTIRRLEIGVEGSRAAVLALREGAEALASFAHGDFAGGGLHLASAAQFAATAALAAQESLGGGRTASAGGGGGVSGAGTFEPRDNGSGGSQTIYLITKDPFGREQMQRVQWELDRAGVMKRPPIEIPPTSGIGVLR